MAAELSDAALDAAIDLPREDADAEVLASYTLSELADAASGSNAWAFRAALELDARAAEIAAEIARAANGNGRGAR